MKSSRSLALTSITLALVTHHASAAVWQWDGGASTSNWQTAANWNPDALNPDYNGTYADRLNVNGGQKLVYSSAEGTTLYTGDTVTGGGRGLTVGSGTSGTMEITGGTFSTASATSADVIGNSNSSTGILTINGGTFIGSTSAGTSMGIGTGTGRVSTLNVQSGSATITALTMNSSNATINLSGGVLAVNSISKVTGSTANINFDGGTLKARVDSTTFLTGLNAATINGGGVSVDSNSKSITIGQNLLAGTGSGGLSKIGAGTLTLSGSNTYTGSTTLSAGTLSVATTSNLGAAASNLVFDGGTLQITGTTLTNFSGIGHSVTFNSGKTVGIDINNVANTFTADQVLNQGTGGLTKAGAGILVLNQNNTYTGDTTISAGAIVKQAVDSTTGNISVTNGATFVLKGGITDGAGQSISINGPGSNTADYFYTGSAIQRGALQAQSGSNTWAGNVVINGVNNTRIGVQNGASLTLSGNITESVAGSALALRAGAAGDNIILSGTGSWTGLTTFFSTGGSIQLAGNNRISTASTAYFSSSGTTVLDLNGNNQEFSGFYSDGSILAEATIKNTAAATTSTLTSNVPASTTYNYKYGIVDGGGQVALTKTGEGTQILSNTSTYTGATTVSGGILAVNGVLGNTTTTIGNGGTLRGSGSIAGSVTAQSGGIIAAGNGIESLATGALTIDAGGTLAYEINNSALAASAGDLTAVTGGLNLDISNGSLLTLAELGASAWSPGAKLTLVSYSGAWNGGLFSYNLGTLADDSTFNFSGTDWLFNYNDTTAGTNFTGDLTGSSFVTMTAIPEPATAALSMLGLATLLRRRRQAR